MKSFIVGYKLINPETGAELGAALKVCKPLKGKIWKTRGQCHAAVLYQASSGDWHRDWNTRVVNDIAKYQLVPIVGEYNFDQSETMEDFCKEILGK